VTVRADRGSGFRTDWRTPPDLFAAWHARFRFTVDAAASDDMLFPRWWGEADDALTLSWAGERVYCNPPYGPHLGDWIRKAAEREAVIAVLLIPVRSDTAWWHEAVWPCAEIEFLRGRVGFAGMDPGQRTRAPFPSCLAIYRKLP